MTKPARAAELASYVQVGRRFQRAVNLERDLGRRDALKGYKVTPAVTNALRQIGSGLHGGSSDRAWSLIGPYGSGKSAFAVFLSDLLAPQGTAARAEARKLSKAAGAAFGQNGGLNPVVLTGERAPLDVILLRALHGAVERVASTRRGRKPPVLGTLAKLMNGSAPASQRCATSEVVRCFEEAAGWFHKATDAGLLLVVDEAGKLLEYAAQQPARGDVYLLQALAESASRSNGAPFVLMTILHQSFEQYADRLSTSQRNEWRKVQGRFGDLLFREGLDQIIGLTASALERTSKRPEVKGWEQTIKLTAVRVSEGTGWDQKQLEQHLEACWPLHPVTAVLLGPLFRGGLAQNERSLFAFLSTAEPFSFREFLRTSPSSTLYTVDQLYDYAMATLGSRLFGRAGRGWSEISTALDRLSSSAGELDAKVLKTVGLLSILGDQVGLKASSETVAACLPGYEGVSECLTRLSKESRIVYRAFRDAYQIWEGSDLDLDQLVDQATDQLAPDFKLASALQHTAKQRPIVARRHLFKTGTLRFFEVRFVEAAAILRGERIVPDESADGLIILAVPRNVPDISTLKTFLAQPMTDVAGFGGSRPLLAGVPSSIESVEAMAQELLALETVQTNTTALQTDPVAKRELAARVDGVRQRLDSEIATTFSSAGCQWFAAGKPLRITSSRELSEEVSTLCDETYSAAPVIRNELLNRRSLSSSAARARRNLLEAMVLHPSKEQLGFTGYPPEVSMYRSVLQALGMHRRRRSKWEFTKPDKAAPTLVVKLNRFFDGTELKRQSLSDLYEDLRQPPFGIKDGVLPVIVCAALLEREDEVGLYENGTFIPSLTGPVIERLLRSERPFEVRQCRVTGVRQRVFKALSTSLMSATKQRASILDVVRGLVRFVAGLPAYSRKAGEVSSTARQVRDALLRAREPAALLFDDLPRACGSEGFRKGSRPQDDSANQFVSTLRAALRELDNAYPALVERLLLRFADDLGLPSSLGTCRTQLSERALQLSEFAGEVQLKAFLARAADQSLDPDEWLVSLAAQVAGKPPIEWVDGDEDSFNARLALIARRFRSLEVLLADMQAPEDGSSLLRLSVLQQGKTEQERVLTLREPEQPAVHAMRDSLLKLVAKKHRLSPDAKLTALALAAECLLHEDSRTGKVS